MKDQNSEARWLYMLRNKTGFVSGHDFSRAVKVENMLGSSACVRNDRHEISPEGTVEPSPGRSPGFARALEKSRRDD
jgi:hypothetical protein